MKVEFREVMRGSFWWTTRQVKKQSMPGSLLLGWWNNTLPKHCHYLRRHWFAKSNTWQNFANQREFCEPEKECYRGNFANQRRGNFGFTWSYVDLYQSWKSTCGCMSGEGMQPARTLVYVGILFVVATIIFSLSTQVNAHNIYSYSYWKHLFNTPAQEILLHLRCH